jgi:hypothetical protein
MTKCLICSKLFYCDTSLKSHIFYFHKISTHEYYDLFFKKQKNGICEIEDCNNKTKFINGVVGYRRFCSKKCSRNSKISQKRYKETCKERYGDENYNNLTKQKQTLLEKYGVDNFFKSTQFRDIVEQKQEEINNKKRETCIKNYGESHYMKTEEGKKNFTSKKDETFKKYSKTCKERYNVDWYS